LVKTNLHLRVEQKDLKSQLDFTNDHFIYRTVKEASYELGFVEEDAELIGLAWYKLSPSMDTFDIHHWPSNPDLFGIKGYQANDAFPSCPMNLGLYVIAPNAKWVEKLLKAGVQYSSIAIQIG
jgi:thiamine-phosphate pyrophosphorylase